MDPKDQPSAIGQLLKQLREDAGLSLYELERRSGVNRAKLQRIESGEIRHPTMPTLTKLAAAHDIEPEDLYDAVWQDSSEPLPSPAVYFRSKYHLSDEQIAELESTVDRVIAEDGT